MGGAWLGRASESPWQLRDLHSIRFLRHRICFKECVFRSKQRLWWNAQYIRPALCASIDIVFLNWSSSCFVSYIIMSLPEYSPVCLTFYVHGARHYVTCYLILKIEWNYAKNLYRGFICIYIWCFMRLATNLKFLFDKHNVLLCLN